MDAKIKKRIEDTEKYIADVLADAGGAKDKGDAVPAALITGMEELLALVRAGRAAADTPGEEAAIDAIREKVAAVDVMMEDFIASKEEAEVDPSAAPADQPIPALLLLASRVDGMSDGMRAALVSASRRLAKRKRDAADKIVAALATGGTRDLQQLMVVATEVGRMIASVNDHDRIMKGARDRAFTKAEEGADARW